MASKNISLLFIAFIFIIAVAQDSPCKICAKIKQCSQQLLSDPNIDPIYNSIVKQLSISDYPNAISKDQNEKEIIYVFTWSSKTYQATVDKATRSFKVVDQSPSNPLENLQLSLGLRKNDIFGNQVELITRIDKDIKNKYFASQKVLCLAVTPSYNGFQAIYQKEDYTVVVFDIFVKTEGGNTEISYQINNSALTSSDKRSISYENIPVNSYSMSSSATILQPYVVKNQQQSQVQNTQSTSTTSSTKLTLNQDFPTISTGGYSQVSINSQSVTKIFNFLIASVGQIVKYGMIVKCEKQVINGFNYRLTVSFDTQSTLQYIIVVYETPNGQYSVSSINFANQRKDYSFSKSISSQQASKIVYLPSLVKNVMTQLADILTTDSILVAVYKDFPFFKFVYSNKQYQEISLTVQYEILKNVINVIDRNVIKRVMQKPAETVVVPPPVAQPPKRGGYQTISSNDQQLQTVFSFLIDSIGLVFKSATLIQAQRQVVNGYNYRLTVSFDSQSSSKYILVVYQSIEGKLSFQSSDLVEYSKTYNFAKTLSDEEISKISYINSLSSLIINQFSNILISDTVIDSISKDFPYFQFSYHNSAYKTITIVVFYDLIRNSITVINQNAIPLPKVEPVQPILQPSSAISSNAQMTVSSIQIQRTQVDQNICGADYQLAGQSIRQQAFVQSYLDYIVNVDSRCTRQVLIGIFWKKDDKNFLKFIFRFSDGSIREFKGSCDYIQYTLRNKKTKTKKIVIPNCLSQSGNICAKCVFKYYLNNGNCLPVQLQCSDFNEDTNTCEGCYTGYYLDYQGVCQKSNYLCSSSDRKGFCLSCFNNYRLTTRGTCVYRAEGASQRLIEQQDNPLCSKFNQLKCLECVKGCYMNQIGVCKIPDPNCITFDEKSQTCLVCVDNYFISQSTRTCIPTPNYN